MKINNLFRFQLICIVFIGIISNTLYAYTPFQYTGYARSCGCELLVNYTNTDIDAVKIEVIKVDADGTSKYSETHSMNTDANGMYNITVGVGGSNISGIFPTDLEWQVQTNKYFIRIKIKNCSTACEGGGEEVVQRLKYVVGDGVIVDPAPAEIAENAGIVRYLYNSSCMQFFNGLEWTTNCEDTHCGPCHGQSILTDVDGNQYPIVEIGDQCWMAKNLETGVKIDISSSFTSDLVIEKKCFNNDCSNGYGGFYSWGEMMNYTTVDEQGICPEGWHIPFPNDYYTLIAFLGGSSIASTKLMIGGGSGFNALPVSYINSNYGIASYLWSYSVIVGPYGNSFFIPSAAIFSTSSGPVIPIRCIKK